MTFSSSKHKREAGKSTVVKCLNLVLSNKFINTSPYFYILNISFSKAIVYMNQELSFLLKDKQEKKRRRMTMNQGYHQAKLAVLILAIRMNLKN